MANVNKLRSRVGSGLVVLSSALACASPTTDAIKGSSFGGAGMTSGSGGAGNSSGAFASAGGRLGSGGSAPLAFGGGNNGSSGSSAAAGAIGVSGAPSGGYSGTSSGGGAGGIAGAATSGGAGGGGASGASGAQSIAGAANAGTGGETASGPCDNPIDVTGGNSGGFKTTGAVCLRTKEDFDSLGCSNMDGRTIKVNGVAATCGGSSFAPKIGGFNYFDISAGANDYASIYWFSTH